MVVFLLECKEDEERQANFPSKEASSPILEMTASFSDGACSSKLFNKFIMDDLVIYLATTRYLFFFL